PRARRRGAGPRHRKRDDPRRGARLRPRSHSVREARRIVRPSQSAAAARGAERGGSMTAGAVRRDLESPDPEVRRRAVSVIPDLAENDAADLVLSALGDGDWRVRKEASQIAFLLGPNAVLLEKLV